MASESAVMKRYCIVMVAVGTATYKFLEEPVVILVIALLCGVFWLLDAKYLQQEHWFRNIYDQVRSEPPGRRPDYRLTPDEGIRNSVSMGAKVIGWSTMGLYLPIIVALLLVWNGLRSTGNG
jgi:hypothetical protein